MGTSAESDVFPAARHLPLGRRHGTMEITSDVATSLRPFGMSLARTCATPAPLDVTALGYDPVSQTGTIRDGDRIVPLCRHTDGQTNTVTDGGDGQGSNQDSDTDHRED